MDERPILSVVIPVFNEAQTLRELHRRLSAVGEGLPYRLELVFVDDGSTDGSAEALRALQAADARVRVVELRRNFGQTPALRAGLDHARGSLIATMDADLQHFPEDLPALLKELEQGWDVVCGWRKERREGLARRLPSRVANRLVRSISGLAIHDFGTTYRVVRREVLADLPLFGELHRFIPALAHFAGFRIKEVPIQNIERPSGQSHYGLSRTFGVFLDLLFLLYYVRYLTRPMLAFGKLAALFFAPGFFIAATLLALAYGGVIRTVRDHDAMLLFAVMLMIMGIQFLAVGILAEVVNRIYVATSRQPIYRVRRVWEKNP